MGFFNEIWSDRLQYVTIWLELVGFTLAVIELFYVDLKKGIENAIDDFERFLRQKVAEHLGLNRARIFGKWKRIAFYFLLCIVFFLGNYIIIRSNKTVITAILNKDFTDVLHIGLLAFLFLGFEHFHYYGHLKAHTEFLKPSFKR